MSRKWERMIEKNRQKANELRKKQGKQAIGYSERETMIQFKGRNWFLPALFILFSIVYLYVFRQQSEIESTNYWMTSILYFLFGLFLFFFRRPLLKIGKDQLASRRFTGMKYVAASDIENIAIVQGAVVIQMKRRRGRWMFNRLFQRMDLDDVSDKLREFAHRHRIPVSDSL
jgi:hypothetical protein